VNTVLLDCQIYDKLEVDRDTRGVVRSLVETGAIRVIATPMVLDELRRSPFEGFPDWFSVVVEAESATVLDYAPLGMTRLGDGEVYTSHRGQSKKIPDAIIADSANLLADILVSDDRRCRERLKKISTRCKGLDYGEFCEWVRKEIKGAGGGDFYMPKTESASSVYKAAAILRAEERAKLEELVSLVSTALQNERDPKIRQQLEQSLAEAQQALNVDRENP